LTAVIEHFKALDRWVAGVENVSKFFEEELDLSELFRPDVFFNSLRQYAARESRISMDGLKLVCSFGGPMRGVNLNVKISGFQLECCGFDGHRLIENHENSASVVNLPPCYVSWIEKVFLVEFVFCEVPNYTFDMVIRL
jgi:dynein heavy chain 2